MKALLCTAFGPIDSLRIEDVAIRWPRRTVRVKAASLNFPDALIVQGLYQVKPALPFSPGAEFAGVIDAVGEGVTRGSRGMRWSRSPGTAARGPTCTSIR